MDDVIILSDSKAELAQIKTVIEEFLKDFLHLDLNKKTKSEASVLAVYNL